MSIIYTARACPAKATQSPDFSTRGIDGYTTGNLEWIQTIGLPTEIQPAYSEYVSNLPAFLTATAIQSRVTCGRTYKPSIATDKLLPLPFPPLGIAPVVALKGEEAEAAYLSPLVDVDFITTVHNRRKLYVITKPTLDARSTYPKTNPKLGVPSDVTNLMAFMDFATTLKIVSLFLATHSYAAFQTETETGARFLSSTDISFQTLRTPSTSVRALLGNYPTEIRQAIGGIVVTGPADIDNYPTQTTYHRNGAVLVAKPAPLYPEVNFGTVSQIPNLPGYPLPYFPGIITPSPDTVLTIMRSYFSKLFGMDETSNNEGWERYVANVPYWSKTESGKALTHILFCIRTALEAQARLFVVISNGNYLGSVIQGYKFNILHQGKLLQAETRSSIVRAMAKMDEHSQAVETITSILRNLTIKGQDDVDMETPLDFNSPRELWALIQERDKPDDEEMDRLTAAVDKLCFVQTFWPIDHQKLCQALDLISLTDDPNLSSLPCHFDSTILYDDSRYAHVMTAFGPNAPSFLDQGGSFVKIPEGVSAPDPQSTFAKEGDKVIRMPKIFVNAKKIKIAINDMRSVFQKRHIKQDPGKRDAGFRTIMFVGPPRDLIWEALRKIPYGVEKKGKGKRAADDDTTEGDGNVEKRRRIEDKVTDIGCDDLDF